MSITEHAKAEMIRAGFSEEEQGAVLEIMRVFFKHWDSGGAVACMLPVLVRLISGQPLAPLTGQDDEWHDPMGDGLMLQNKRCSSVFKAWRDPKSMQLSSVGHGVQLVHDIDAADPFASITFPYDPTTRVPAIPVMTVETQD